MPCRPPANLTSLPSEIIRHICGYLNTADILSLELTDRQQRRQISESGLWRDVVLRSRAKLCYRRNFTTRRCHVVEQMVDFLGRKNLQEARYFKVVLAIIWQLCKIIKVLDSDRYLPSKRVKGKWVSSESTEERIAWDNYLSVVKPLVSQAVLQEKKINPGAGRKELVELWFALNIPTAFLKHSIHPSNLRIHSAGGE